MAKPQNTYRRAMRRDRIRHVAVESKKKVQVSRKQDLTEFHKELSWINDDELDDQHRAMAVLANKLRNNEPLSEDDEVSKNLSKLVGQLRKVLVKVQDRQQFSTQVRASIDTIIHAPINPGSTGVELVLVIALLRVLEFMIFVRRKN